MIPGIIASSFSAAAEPPIASPAAWYRFGVGITEAGTGVSQWDDKSGNARHLTQGTDANRPSKEADGSLLFNGTSDVIKTGAWVQAQPVTIYGLLRQVTWTAGRYFWNNKVASASMRIGPAGVTPDIYLSGSVNGNVAGNTNLTLNTYKALGAVYNDASSLIHVNGSSATTGDNDTGSIDEFVLGGYAAALLNANIQVKEILIYAAAHDATQRQTVFDYLAAL